MHVSTARSPFIRPPKSTTMGRAIDYKATKRPPSARSRSTTSSGSTPSLPAARKGSTKKKIRLDLYRTTAQKRGLCTLPPKMRTTATKIGERAGLPIPAGANPRTTTRKQSSTSRRSARILEAATEQITSTGELPREPQWARKDVRALKGVHHEVLEMSLRSPFPENSEQAIFGAGCFWGTEKGFWKLPGVLVTAAGYAGGKCCDPRYEQVRTGKTGHTECTLVVWDPLLIGFGDLLRQFWRCHDPTQGNRQGNDKGSQYRSAIYCSSETQLQQATKSRDQFNRTLGKHNYSSITTEIKGEESGIKFWYAEPKHQQYLSKPGSRPYCSAEPTGIPVPNIEGSKLPKTFWKVYDCSVGSSNEQVSWRPEGNNNKKLEAQAKEQASRAAAAKSRAESLHNVTIQYCGGCGFSSRAMELADVVRQRAGVEPALVRDTGVTGRFDVRVKQDGQFKLVHSKQDGDGFVDTETKAAAIIDAVIAAAA